MSVRDRACGVLDLGPGDLVDATDVLGSLSAYNYGSRTFQVLVNGQTGRIAGKHPYSWVKIALAIVAILIAILIVGWLQDR